MPAYTIAEALVRRAGFERLLPQEFEVRAALPAIRAFLDTGAEGAPLETLDLGDLAALRLVRARTLASRGDASGAMLKQALTTDSLNPVVLRAAKNWPAPKRAGRARD